MMALDPRARERIDQYNARRTAWYRGEAPLLDNRLGAHTVGAVTEITPGIEIWTVEDGRRNWHEDPLGGIVLAGTAIDQAIALLDIERQQLLDRVAWLDTARSALRRIQDGAHVATPDSGRISPPQFATSAHTRFETVTCTVCGKTLKRPGLGPHMTSHRRAQELVSPDEVLALLDHPEWVAGATRRNNGAWVRTDGEMWTCSCGRAVRNLSQLRSHMGSVVDPTAHRPGIARADQTSGSPQPAAATVTAAPSPAPAVTHAPAETGDPDQPAPTAAGSRPYGCSCYARFATSREWADHRRSKPAAEQTKHRLVDQPKAAIVPSGLPASPPRRDDQPGPHIVIPHGHRVGAL